MTLTLMAARLFFLSSYLSFLIRKLHLFRHQWMFISRGVLHLAAIPWPFLIPQPHILNGQVLSKTYLAITSKTSSNGSEWAMIPVSHPVCVIQVFHLLSVRGGSS